MNDPRSLTLKVPCRFLCVKIEVCHRCGTHGALSLLKKNKRSDTLTSEAGPHGEVVLLDPQQLLGLYQQSFSAVLPLQFVVDSSERHTKKSR